MNTITDQKPFTGTWKNGQILLDEPADWPEGCRVVVIPEASSEVDGMTEVEQSDDPEAIARWVAAFDAIPPWQMSAEEEAEWHAARQAVKDYTIARVTMPER